MPNNNDINESELLVQYSHRSLWVTLAGVSLLGAYAVCTIMFPESAAAASANRLMQGFPIVIVLLLGILQYPLRRRKIDPTGPAMQRILNDELRQFSLQRAYRNALGAVVVAQPLLVALLYWRNTPGAAAFMASATGVIGLFTVLASILYYDR